MRDVALRNHKDRLMAPMARRWFVHIHPNVISVVALGVGLLAALAVVQQAYWLGMGLWFANRALDGLDGLVARQQAKQSDFGGYLDLLLDFIVYLALPLAFVVAQPTVLHLWSVALLLAAYVLNIISWTVLAAILEKRKLQHGGRSTAIEMPAGLIEGAETILFYTLFFLLPWALGYLFLLMAFLVLITAGQRVVWAYGRLR